MLRQRKDTIKRDMRRFLHLSHHKGNLSILLYPSYSLQCKRHSPFSFRCIFQFPYYTVRSEHYRFQMVGKARGFCNTCSIMRDFRFDIWPVSKEFTILAILSSKNLSQRIWIKFLSCLSCYVFGMAQMGKKCNIKARGSIQFLFSVVVMYFSCFLNCQGPKDEKIWITKSCYLKAGMHIRFHISFSYSRLFERCYYSSTRGSS